MTDNPDPLTSPSTADPPDPRIAVARLAFGAELLQFGKTIGVQNYVVDGKSIKVALYEDGRIEQRDTASHVAKISNLTVKIMINGMPFDIDQHSILSTPNDLIYAINHVEGEVQVVRTLAEKLQGIDTIAMVSSAEQDRLLTALRCNLPVSLRVIRTSCSADGLQVHFKFFLNTGLVDTSKAQSVTHIGPSNSGYKLSIQIACLRLAVALNATRFLTHVIKEIEYVWLSDDLSEPQLFALIQAAPYLDRLLMLWTFVMPARNFMNKDNFIRWALGRLPHYRNLVRQHATRYAGRPMMPSGTYSECFVAFLGILWSPEGCHCDYVGKFVGRI